MELRDYLIPIRKWWWLLLLATAVSTGASLVATRLQDPQYQTTTTLMIGQAIEDPNPNNVSIYLTQQLAQSYAEIAKRQPVRDATMEELGLTWLPQYRVAVVPNTQLLEITVVDTEPVRAQAVANTLAEQLVLQSPTSTQEEEQQRQAFIEGQLDSLETKITDTEEEIAELQAEMANMISARQIANTQSQIATLQSKLTTLQDNYARLLSNTREGAINTLHVIEHATLPQDPVNANRLTTILLGAAIGLVLSTGAAYLMEYMDDTLKTPDEISRELELPVIGFIAEMASARGNGLGAIVAEQPRSPIAEAYRSLRTNLEFAGVDRPLQTILITSPNPTDGKTTVAANLAVMMAQGGKRTLLVDADMRRPRVHNMLDVANHFGLSDIFRDRLAVGEAVQAWDGMEGLRVLSSGSLPPNPAELLGSAKMDQILEEAQETADVVVIDSPPFLVSDASVLAAKVDGVVLVIRPGRTNVTTAKAMLEQFQRADARVVGVVLNRIPRGGGFFYGGYQYYYAPYYDSNNYYTNGQATPANGRSGARGALSGLLTRLRGPATEDEG